ncbi:short-chain dehydrogenase [Mycolicibacterium fortuitum]|uniref:Short-chain dehydrogenase n=1 Tax=Mycolicibacterium fortuitum TaxID=1766 RepID=A0ABD6QD78_MYCFO|nr:SDR family oxidoreductase [Mycolicibacterium fortuitum]OMC35078.1 short-chain dehydrogenase [Mycolicibacterium fortuitum]
MNWPSGQGALVTGAASGIGRGVARALGAAGVKVALVDINGEGLADVEAEIAEAGGTTRAISFDISDLEQWDSLAQRAEDEIGPISILCNIAGVNGGGTIDHTPLAVWRWVYGVNVDAQFAAIAAFLPRFKRRGGRAHIVNTASIAGIVPMAGALAYSSSKYACMGLSLVLREELKESNVGLSLLIPGSVATPINLNAAQAEARILGTEADLDVVEANSSLLQLGADPNKVGDQVLEAISGNEFYVVTHREWGELAARTNRELERAYEQFDGRHGPDPTAEAIRSGEHRIVGS